MWKNINMPKGFSPQKHPNNPVLVEKRGWKPSPTATLARARQNIKTTRKYLCVLAGAHRGGWGGVPPRGVPGPPGVLTSKTHPLSLTNSLKQKTTQQQKPKQQQKTTRTSRRYVASHLPICYIESCRHDSMVRPPTGGHLTLDVIFMTSLKMSISWYYLKNRCRRRHRFLCAPGRAL
jgi:hypothetical protein